MPTGTKTATEGSSRRDPMAAVGRDLRRYAGTLVGLVVLLWVVELADLIVFGGSLDR